MKNYDAQLATAIDISNRSLRACNTALSENGCEEVRALYWKFQLESVTSCGIESVLPTLHGFCKRYGINGDEKRRLISKVEADILDELERNKDISSVEKEKLASGFCIRRGPVNHANS